MQATLPLAKSTFLDAPAELFLGTLKMFATEERERRTVESFRDAFVASGAAEKLEDYQNWKSTLSPRARANIESSVEVPLEAAAEFVGLGGVIKGGKLVGKGLNTVSETGRNLGANVVNMTPRSVRIVTGKQHPEVPAPT